MHTGHLPKEEAAEGHDVTWRTRRQELQRKDVSCPDKYTTKLNKAWAWAWVAFGGVGGTADLRGMQ